MGSDQPREMGWGRRDGRKVQKGGNVVATKWLIHVEVWTEIFPGLVRECKRESFLI